MSGRVVIGVCFCGTGEEYHDKICNGIMDYTTTLENVRLIFYTSFLNSDESSNYATGELSVFDLIDYSRLDGMIILGQTIKDDTVLDKIITGCLKNGVKTVCYDYSTDRCSCVVHDSFKAVYDLTCHLIKEHGCKKINFMTGSKTQVVSLERSNAYMKALSDNGLPVSRDRIGEGMWWTYTAEQECLRWLDEGMEFDGVVCANDLMAMSVIKALRSRGIRVPEDVKVAGYDKIKEGFYHKPAITTAGFHFADDVRIAVDIILGAKPEGEYVRELELVFRKSCGCCGAEPTQEKTNIYHRSMYDCIDGIDANNSQMYSLVSAMIEQKNAGKSFELLNAYIQGLWTSKLWVCINKELIVEGAPDLSRRFDNLNNMSRHYSAQARVIAAKDSNVKEEMIVRPSEELCPDFDRRLDECKNLMVFPLHINDFILGYVVKEHAANFYMDKWKAICMNLSTALLAVKQKNDMRIANLRLEEAYRRDPMTQIYNRRGFFYEMKKHLMTSRNKTMLVVSVDLDGLKSINDSYGHKEGDNAIITVARAMVKAAEDGLFCARFGGDEFIAAGSYNEDCGFEERFLELLCEYNTGSKKPYNVMASVGCVVQECSSFNELDRLIKLADEKMYLRKTCCGRGCRNTPEI